MKACILVKTKTHTYDGIAESILEFAGVESAFVVMGRTDIVVRAEVDDLMALSVLALNIGAIEDVSATETLLALEV
jgi:DNA-binding Lrp family transcriptional regulator